MEHFVQWFRQAGPYINAHRGKTFVVQFGGAAVDSDGFSSLIHDLALLNALGVRLVLAHGARPQVEQRLREAGRELRYVNGLRLTDLDDLRYVKQAVGRVRIRIEALLSMGVANSPMHGARLRVVSGNLITARPLGVREGVDYRFTGEVRRIDDRAIRLWLDQNAIVLLSPLGYSPTGEIFNLSAEDVATATAMALRADKLLVLSESPALRGGDGRPIRELSPSDVERLLASRDDLGEESTRHLGQALQACRAGVRRIHLLERSVEGALLLELFTRDGIGTLITSDIYEGLRPATIDDIGGILALIQPLEDDGTLVRRSRERLEMEIERFSLLERDGAIIGCMALYPFPEEHIGELACVAMHPNYRNSGRAESLLRFIERRAREQGLQRLFVLTTRAAHWFQERGFEPAEVTELPVRKLVFYNWQRRSKVFVKPL
ncbi:MAG TPA: amino-acid N-acetyltransferase [Candidatus Competibacter sp.]|nr:amino-acid N-acetyltransferase [Candidatus Competibacteraceae bacterium]HAO32149.1 amino-acid N-acetyltransferase [Candidatus Competibacteraceae bacterium]HRE54282.1 amino-acid N-acetyltransferase [Candidatus Competibacter sp.]HUM92950.1 amino-acid N-acetyltransferase [Candidatus Competibacter sp.]